jgi:hypothetical protein
VAAPFSLPLLRLRLNACLKSVLDTKIKIFEREASSLVFAGEYANTDRLIDHFYLQELYFSEDEKSYHTALWNSL